MQVGAFRLDHPVMSGSSGTVWRGEHRATGRAVAVKFVPFTAGAKDSDIYRFRAEVRSIARIVHPGVVRIYDEGILQLATEPATRYREDLISLEGSPYIVMEWAFDGSLAQQPRPSNWAQLATILQSLLEALGASHAHGVIHRDVKPQNILISGERILLTDFGVAFERDAPGTDVNRLHLVGSPNYMAPEQVLRRWRELGPWTDLYAVGCVGWLLATGAAPFDSTSSRDVLLAQVKKAPPAFRPSIGVPPGFADWLRRLLEKNATKRFRFAADAKEALLALGGPTQSAVTTNTLVPILGSKNDKHHNLIGLSGTTTLTARDNKTSCPSLARDWRTHEVQRASDIFLDSGLSVFNTSATAFVGRHAERDILWRQLIEVAEGNHSQACLVSGSPGSGKTALIRWFMNRLHEGGFAELLRCQHDIHNDNLDALRSMLEHCFGAWDLDEVERLTQLRKQLSVWDAQHIANELNAFIDAGQKTGVANDTVALVSEKERFMALCSLLKVLSSERPLVVVIEDAQWGTAALEWFRFAMTEFPDLKVMWLITWRTGLDRRHARFTDWLRRHERCQES